MAGTTETKPSAETVTTVSPTTKPKRHHYVPEFYLRYFCPEKCFWVYDKEGGTPRLQTPHNTAVEGHMYSLNVPEGMEPDILEKAIFGPVEDKAKSVLDRWQSPSAKPTVHEVLRVAPFLAFMHTRVPRSIEMVREINLAAISQIHKDLAENPDRQRDRIPDCTNAPPACGGALVFLL